MINSIGKVIPFLGFVLFFSLRLISESIPWLVAKGRIRDAKKILEKAARWNNVELPEKYRLTEEEEQLLKIIVRKQSFHVCCCMIITFTIPVHKYIFFTVGRQQGGRKGKKENTECHI